MYKYYCDLILDNTVFSSNYEDIIHFQNDEERNNFYNYLSEENDKQVNFNRGNGRDAVAVAYLNNYYFYENRKRIINPSLSKALNAKYARVKEINDLTNEIKYYFYFVQNVEIQNSNTIKLVLQIDIFTTYTGIFESFTNKVQIERYCCDRFTADSTASNLVPNWSAFYLKAKEDLNFPKNALLYYNLNYSITDKTKEQNEDSGLTEAEAISLVNELTDYTYDYYFVQENNKVYIYVGSNDKIRIQSYEMPITSAILNSDLLFEFIQKNKSAQLMASYTSHLPPYFFFNSYISILKIPTTGERFPVIQSLINNAVQVFENNSNYGYLVFEKSYKEMTINRVLQDFSINWKIDLDFEPKQYANSEFFEIQLRLNSSTYDFSISQFETNSFSMRNISSLTASNFLDKVILIKPSVVFNLGSSTENSYSIEMLGDNFNIWQANNKNWQKQFALSTAVSATAQALGVGASFVASPILGVASGLSLATNLGTNLISKKFELENIKNAPSSLISGGSNYYYDSIGALNKPVILTRGLQDSYVNYLKEYFKRNGYLTQEFLNPRDCFIRERFNFIQMNLKSHSELPSINVPRIIEDDLFLILNNGIRIWEIKDDLKNNILDFEKSNYEKRLINE